jgi:Ca2+-binding RTX toxin-like protein
MFARRHAYTKPRPDHEMHGLFGIITANPAGTNPVSATLTNGDLVITGSRDNDNIEVELNRTGDKIVVENHDQVIGQFDRAAVATIHFNGFSGNDVFVVDRQITATVIAHAGAGDDVIVGGGGNNILIGGSGNNVLVAGAGRDILIGGTGRDVLVGGRNDDILIAGSTAYDNNEAALLQIESVWSSDMSYADRVTAIRTGTNGVPKLDATTVTDNGNKDVLYGGTGQDWFFATPPARIHHKTPDEQVN